MKKKKKTCERRRKLCLILKLLKLKFLCVQSQSRLANTKKREREDLNVSFRNGRRKRAIIKSQREPEARIYSLSCALFIAQNRL